MIEDITELRPGDVVVVDECACYTPAYGHIGRTGIVREVRTTPFPHALILANSRDWGNGMGCCFAARVRRAARSGG